MKRFPLFLLLGTLLAGCSAFEDARVIETQPVTVQTNLVQAKIPVSQVPLFADLTKYNLLPDAPSTRSNDEELVGLSELIDWSKTTERKIGEMTYSQVPFYQNGSSFLAEFSDEMNTDNAVSAVRIKKFLVKTLADNAEPIVQIVTLVTSSQYASTHPNFDFLSRPNYTGALLFSTPSGELLGVRIYKDGLICDAEILSPSEYNGNEGDDNVKFITYYGEKIQTRDGDGDGIPIRGCGCFGVKFNWITGSICIGNGGSGGGDAGGNNKDNSGYGPNGRNNQEKDLRGNGNPLVPQEPKCVVNLATNSPDEISIIVGESYSMSLGLYGYGEYSPDTRLNVYPTYTNSVSQLEFSYWTGYFDGKTTDEFSFVVKEDVEAVAYYQLGKPCTDKTRGITNPLHNMTVASSSDWGNYYGGTYGDTRHEYDENGELIDRFHNGLDLYAEPGTPVYAMYSGTVTKVVSNYSDEYVRNSFGNEIWVTSSNGLTVKYCHLQAGNPIGTNYITGSIYKEGDPVYQGSVIGYSGRTGNATDVPNPHLHLSMSINGVPKDPSAYINGTINASKVNSTNGKIDNIKCDK